jgi:hypothetical protein
MSSMLGGVNPNLKLPCPQTLSNMYNDHFSYYRVTMYHMIKAITYILK